MSDRLDRAVRGVFGGRAPLPPAANPAEHLAHLEREMHDVRTRVNGLFFAVIAANLGEVIARVFVS